MIIVGRELRSEVLQHHPGLDLGFLADRLDVPTLSEKRSQAQQAVTSPPPLTPIMEEASQPGVEEPVEEGHPLKAVPEPTKAGEVRLVEQPTTEVVEAAAAGTTGNKAGIFGDCGSFEKI